MAGDDLERARDRWSYRGSTRPEWAIEPGPGQESVWDYPRPPRLEPYSPLVRVTHGTTVVAETRSAVRVLETASPPTIYISPKDVRTDLLVKARGSSMCEWKGAATYWTLDLDGCIAPSVAWTYETPFPDFAEIGGYYSFYPSKVNCQVDGERVRAQLGGFYGGWVTSDIVGPFKGQAGTGNW
jgi:uncharacterized protein (DUF427 family)